MFSSELIIYGVLASAICAMLAFLVYFVIRKRGESQFLNLAQELSEDINSVRQELEELYLPTRLAVDKDIEDFKAKHESLLEKIEILEKHKY
mgnify:CR=1 FL=1